MNNKLSYNILVVSDTHGTKGFIEKLINKYPNYQLYLHAGDSELTSEELYPFETVKGNCDYYISNRIRLIKANNINILMFHGDKFLLEEDMLVAYAKNYDAKIIIHGHTHIPFYKYCEGVHILCPGSLTYPRVTRATYALIHIYDENDIKVEFINYDNR